MVIRPRVTLYTRKRCCLCDDVKAMLDAARAHAEFDLEELDIDTDPELLRLYNEEVPVIAINGRNIFQYRVDMNELIRRLKAGA